MWRNLLCTCAISWWLIDKKNCWSHHCKVLILDIICESLSAVPHCNHLATWGFGIAAVQWWNAGKHLAFTFYEILLNNNLFIFFVSCRVYISNIATLWRSLQHSLQKWPCSSPTDFIIQKFISLITSTHQGIHFHCSLGDLPIDN